MPKPFTFPDDLSSTKKAHHEENTLRSTCEVAANPIKAFIEHHQSNIC